MVFLICGIVMLLLYVSGVAPVAGWHWGYIALPFVLAVAWWTFIDAAGITRRRQERKIEERKVARRERDMEALGLKITPRGSKRRRAASSRPAPGTDPQRRDPP